MNDGFNTTTFHQIKFFKQSFYLFFRLFTIDSTFNFYFSPVTAFAAALALFFSPFR